jgi:hypothetical protein
MPLKGFSIFSTGGHFIQLNHISNFYRGLANDHSGVVSSKSSKQLRDVV